MGGRIDAVQEGHRHVENNNVRLQGFGCFDQGSTVGGSADEIILVF
jgi:hypothetical protein